MAAGVVSDQRPWWFSGPEQPEPPPASAPGPVGGTPGLGDLLAVASTLVDWATDKVMAPHADHADPGEHPQCLICRASRVMGAGAMATQPVPRDARTIQWIDIDEESADPRDPHRDPSP